MYTLLDDLIYQHHEDLRQARIALAWCTSWKADADGRITLGKCRKASDLDRELTSLDFVILLQRNFWHDERVTDQQRRALLDHELCHAALKFDDRGEPCEDVRGRLVYRVRKHDLEEFVAIVDRYGTYTRDIEQFYAALKRADKGPWKPCEACRESPGWAAVPEGRGVQRCECWVAWRDRQAGTEGIQPALAVQ